MSTRFETGGAEHPIDLGGSMVRKGTVDGGVVLVTFCVPHEVAASEVHLVGDFNEWSTITHPMCRTQEGFVVDMALRAGSVYRFRYFVDGARWENDWAADDYIPNEYGGNDSIVDLR